MRAYTLVLLLVSPALPACADGECLVFDFAPPSAHFTLTVRDTGETVCDATVTTLDERVVIGHPSRCSYELPEWADTELGQKVTLVIEGYEDETVTFPAPVEDDCGAIMAPADQAFEVSPGGTEE